tara:strand:- start:99 stop:359 length:261 start_codon:yes stop_codon:yes gene_type:complete
MKIFLFKSIIVFVLSYVLINLTIVSKIDDMKHQISVLSDKETIVEFKAKLLSEIDDANKKKSYFTEDEKRILSNFIKKISEELNLN